MVLTSVLTRLYRVVKSSRQPAKIAAFLVSIGQLLCLAFLYGWHFLNKISLDWPLTLTTQPPTSKLSDNPGYTILCESVLNGINNFIGVCLTYKQGNYLHNWFDLPDEICLSFIQKQ